jgi:NDP-sugar pyrophosphorylase family protein
MRSMPPIAVLAGGLATRMQPATLSVPKSMLEVAGEPFIAHQLRLFRREGFERVVLCLGYLGDQVAAFVEDGGRYDLQVLYSYDGDVLLGTGGALRRTLPLLGEEFLVTYGDSYLDIPYRPLVDAFRAASTDGLMTVFRNAGRWDTSNIEFADGRIMDYSKKPTPRMTYIDFGLTMLSASALSTFAEGEAFDLADVYRALIHEGRMAGLEVKRRFYEIGSPAGMADTEAYLRERITTRQSR